MTKLKWGETFLKTGLPLEHLTAATLRAADWWIETNPEFERPNEKGKPTWFSVDLCATAPKANRDTDLSLFIECKYHDEDRFWMFLPADDGHRIYPDSNVCNCHPFETLVEPSKITLRHIAPLVSRGTVISRHGQKQDDAVYTAVQQLVNGYVPYSLATMYAYHLDVLDGHLPSSTALIPTIVTNARIFRLRPSVTALEQIRAATAPAEIAEELRYGWMDYRQPVGLALQNRTSILEHVKDPQFSEFEKRFGTLRNEFQRLARSPSCILVVQIDALPELLTRLSTVFAALKTKTVRSILKARELKSRRARRTAKP